jgi:outer membrane biosynthesis protein TonB
MDSRIQIAALLLCLLGCQRAPSKVLAGSVPGSNKMIRYSRPWYPEWARRLHVEGAVQFDGTIGRDGKVRGLTFLKGPRLLAPFAQAAIEEWQYERTSLNGALVETRTQIVVNFTLRQ